MAHDEATDQAPLGVPHAAGNNSTGRDQHLGCDGAAMMDALVGLIADRQAKGARR